MTCLKKYLLIVSLFAASFIEAQVPFTPGNIVVCRVGDGTATLTNIANPVFLDEYTTTGTLVQSIPIPTATLGSNYRLVLSGTALTSQEGNLTLSANKQFLILGGYDVSLGTTNPAVNSTSRVIAVIDHNGNVNTSTNLSDFIPNTTFKAVASSNGIDIWCAGSGGSGTASGVHYTTIGSSTSTQLNAGLPSSFNSLNIADGQLYVTNRIIGYNRIAAIGTSLPTTGGQTINGLPGMPTTGEVNQFIFFDLNASVPGVDVLYYADETLGLQKYSLVGGTWVSNGTVGLPADLYKGLTGLLNAGTVTLYATRKGNNSASINGGQLVQLTDASGYNMAFTGTPTIIVSAAPINTKAFRGIALAPAAAPCLAPSLPAITNVSTTSAIVKWNTIAGANGYQFDVSTNPTPTAAGPTITDTTFVATALTPGTQYYFHLRTQCSATSFSTWVTTTFTTLTPTCELPSTPVINNITSSSARITWPAVNGATGYEYAVLLSASSPASGTAVTNPDTTVGGLNGNTQYYVYVRTRCNNNQFSSWVSASFTTAYPPCSPPSLPIVTTSGTDADVSWMPVNFAVGYEYQLSTNSVPPSAGIAINSTQLHLTGLNAATDYFLHLRTNCGPGGFSPWIKVSFTTACFKPSPVVAVVNVKAGIADIYWSKVNGATSYEYAVLKQSSPPPVGSAASTADTILHLTGLNPGIKHWLYVRSHCGNKGMSDWAILEFHPLGIDIFPNPTRNTVEVRVYGADIHNGELMLMDAAGRRIKVLQLNGNSIIVDMSGLPGGVYLFRYKDQKQDYSTRVIKI